MQRVDAAVGASHARKADVVRLRECEHKLLAARKKTEDICGGDAEEANYAVRCFTEGIEPRGGCVLWREKGSECGHGLCFECRWQ